MKIYILTREINAYDQDGEYFVAAFRDKPTSDELLKQGATHLDRLNNEYEWFNLKECETEN